ncbi:GrpB family protein [Halalkalibacillus halophilus]|uniref:GrpB family protein n=1 Tax=Halalkalibacillus halophilus TaxID=392827 RepID=UPI000489711B|nr:GrpB family protein [Halalkalibacillus halophilus]
MARKVEVIPYSKKWPQLFEKEAGKLRALFGKEIVTIHHIGSTSVPGLKAKPVIDMMPIVQDISMVDSFNDEMQQMGYESKGENGIKGRRYFQKGGDQRSHHVHFYQVGSPEIDRHLAFRDYLRAHPEPKQRYGDLKEELAMRFPDDIESYISGKESYAKEIEKRALDWIGD